MNDVEIIKKISRFPKNLLTVRDLEKILCLKPKTVRVTISRLKKKKIINRVGQGLYVVFGKKIVPQEIAAQIYYPSCLSLRTVLSQSGIINQIPQGVHLITPRKSYRTKINQVPIYYHQIKKELYFGYYLNNQIPTAYPEKALLDLFYFYSLGKDNLSFSEIDRDLIDRKKLDLFKNKFPSETQKLVKKFCPS